MLTVKYCAVRHEVKRLPRIAFAPLFLQCQNETTSTALIGLAMSSLEKIVDALKTLNALDGNDIRDIADAISKPDFSAVSEAVLSEFALTIVEICASLGDAYSCSTFDPDGTAGDAIRAKFGVA